MSAALLPCPFCGGTDAIYIRHVDGTVRRPAYFVACDDCGAQSRATDHGDHIEIWNARAIAPPVAAGSVDIDDNEFRELYERFNAIPGNGDDVRRAWVAIVEHVNSWGAQQREAGRQEAKQISWDRTSAYSDQRVMSATIRMQERAEKAEARVKELEGASPARMGKSLLRPAISAENPLPPGCYCEPGKCAAPKIMGRQTPCRDPEKASGIKK